MCHLGRTFARTARRSGELEDLTSQLLAEVDPASAFQPNAFRCVGDPEGSIQPQTTCVHRPPGEQARCTPGALPKWFNNQQALRGGSHWAHQQTGWERTSHRSDQWSPRSTQACTGISKTCRPDRWGGPGAPTTTSNLPTRPGFANNLRNPGPRAVLNTRNTRMRDRSA